MGCEGGSRGERLLLAAASRRLQGGRKGGFFQLGYEVATCGAGEG
jgi:hypothetical protein